MKSPRLILEKKPDAFSAITKTGASQVEAKVRRRARERAPGERRRDNVVGEQHDVVAVVERFGVDAHGAEVEAEDANVPDAGTGRRPREVAEMDPLVRSENAVRM